MPILRKSDPSKVQCVWDAISSLKWGKIVCDLERVVKELVKSQGSSAKEWEKHIKDMLSDDLLGKALRKDMKTNILSLPTVDRSVSDERDWFCFECHKAGDVKYCKTNSCFRVFHSDCVPKNPNNVYLLFHKLISNSGLTIFLKKGKLDCRKSLSFCADQKEDEMNDYDCDKCSVCNLNRVDDFSIENSEFKSSLRFVHTRSRAWIPENITHKMDGVQPYSKWITETELEIRAKSLFFRHMDMGIIEAKIESDRYSKFSDYLADILIIKHNIGIFHGCESQEYEATEFVLRDVFHDLGEIVSCLDCFKHSNEPSMTDWFCLPCRIPHEIVWAKQKGYCYWPAKVVKKSGSIYDVRFFGGKHERAIVNQDCIKPITFPRKGLQLKNSCSLEKAINEMELLLKLMKNPSELKTYSNLEKKPVRKPNTAVSCNSGSDNKPSKKRKRLFTSTPSKKRGTISQVSEMDTLETGDEQTTLEFKKPLSKTPKKENSVPVKKKRRIIDKKNSAASEETIKISDDEDNVYTFCGSLTKSAMEFSDGTEDQDVEQVTSSTEGETMEVKCNQELPLLNKHYNEEVEMMSKTLQGMSKKGDIIQKAMDLVQTEINRLTECHNEQLKKVLESHKAQISETKKKQWCFFCEKDAIYHCCWNTAYCSVQCQKEHWQKEHKLVCRRKR